MVSSYLQMTTMLLLLLSPHLAWCQDLESQEQQLLSLLAPAPALGQPWPSIPGPDLDDRVCIVGAGASGIHMAMSLKKKNYKKVILPSSKILFEVSILRSWSLRNPDELVGNVLI